MRHIGISSILTPTTFPCIIKTVLKKLLIAGPIVSLIILAMAGSEFASLTPFVDTVNADAYGSQDKNKDKGKKGINSITLIIQRITVVNCLSISIILLHMK